jgi:hypothetical protein
MWSTDQMKPTGVQAKCSEKHLSYCFVHHKTHVDRRGIETGPMQCNASN